MECSHTNHNHVVCCAKRCKEESLIVNHISCHKFRLLYPRVPWSRLGGAAETHMRPTLHRAKNSLPQSRRRLANAQLPSLAGFHASDLMLNRGLRRAGCPMRRSTYTHCCWTSSTMLYSGLLRPAVTLWTATPLNAMLLTNPPVCAAPLPAVDWHASVFHLLMAPDGCVFNTHHLARRLSTKNGSVTRPTEP
jgi:hypothetical protein